MTLGQKKSRTKGKPAMRGTGIILTTLMKLTGIRQNHLAVTLHVNRNTLAGWLAGYARMPDDVIVEILRLLGGRLEVLGKNGTPAHRSNQATGSHPVPPEEPS